MHKKMFGAMGLTFDKQTIVATALTGAAAVSINGETTAKAFALNREIRNELDEFRNTYLVFVDEISFALYQDIESLNQKMKETLDNPMEPFGGVPSVFSGDFTQLSPVGGVRLEFIDLFMELKNNH
ncbi:PIF1-like helicase [Nitzschia inconspicua]|uniref:ATP-dependent DNA helicase n=1 Tax=Nitzschia inconspicua TaxID=303405 RepID=A0A9K3PFQ1_9STRA|nr:PIF1-like helicase [Nitzschia inconspicua]